MLTATLIAVLAFGASALAARADAPVLPDREQARAWAQQELLHPEYQRHQPSLLQRLWDWLRSKIDELPSPGGVPGNLGVAIVAAVLIALLIYVLWRTGGVRRSHRISARPGLFEGTGRTAAEHRAAADAARAGGDYDTAVLERFRGLVAGLQERAVLAPDPGRTADEAAQAAAQWLPDLATEFGATARIFDEVRYGDLPGTPASAAAVRDLDERVQRARPAARPAALVGGPAAPR